MRSAHKIENGSFHLVGFAGGARPATTYGAMSRRYFQSLTAVGSYAWERWDEDEVSGYEQAEIHLLVGENDRHGREVNEMATVLLEKAGKEVHLVILPNEDRVPRSMMHGKLMAYLDETVRGTTTP